MQCGSLTLIALVIAARAAAAAPGEPAPPAAPVAAAADPGEAPAEGETVPRTPTTTLGRMFRGPFRSARLFAMPTADVIGAYVLTVSGEGSLLQQPGVLTSAGVLAVGFGDIAQLEYRHTEAIGITGLDAPVPAVGVQLKLPIPERSGIPAIGVAFRLGVPRGELLDGRNVDETVTDLYLVGRLRFTSLPWLTLHGGTRISFAKAAPAGADVVSRTLWLPTAGYELAMNPQASIIGELALAPQFQWMPAIQPAPAIGRGVLGRLGMKWRIVPSVILEGSLGYQVDDATPSEGFEAVVTWDIRLGAAVFVPWGALACRAVGVFCN
ncbi:MAG: hypothetical protein E6J91_11205 [Deltaproteobacteria bacterium]|nr:MAG: hypothetical protein E6J91_11205 [Deltaproteobacteria bacterium]